MFVIKVFAGTLNLYVHFYTYLTNDIGFFHWQSINELKAMRSNPGHFFYEWLCNWGSFRDGFDPSSPFFTAFWKDLGVLLHSKYMTLANILSFGNQYVNVIIYNIPFFVGQLYLYKVFYRLQPEKKWLYMFVVFLIPSSLFWCSGIHKDGWVLTSFGIVFYSLSTYLQNRRYVYLISFFFGLFLLFIVRYYYMLSLLPLLVLWIYTAKRRRKFGYYGLAMLFTFLLFFNIQRFVPKLNPMKMIQSRQSEFFGLIGYSDMKTPKLENNLMSYIRNFPTAVDHVLLRPRFSTSDPWKYKVAAIDNFLIVLILTLLMLGMRKRNFNNSMVLSIFFFAFSMYIFIGYTIPNCGALVRYKSEFTVLLLACFVALSDYEKLNKYLDSKLSSAKKTIF